MYLLDVSKMDENQTYLSKDDIEILKKEYKSLGKLLLPTNEVEFTEKIGEGSYVCN